MDLTLRIRLSNQTKFMGKGMKELLLAIEQCKSIKQATIHTKISYPKALRMLKDFEMALGFPAVVSEKGGKEYGGTDLTEQGKEVLEYFCVLEETINQYAQKLFLDTFPLKIEEE